MNKKLIIVRGLVGSGKSFLASQLKADIILSTDNIVSVGKYYLWHPDMISASHLVNQTKCKRAMELKINNIVIDNTNTTWKEIAPYVKFAKEYGYAVEVMEPDTNWKFDVNECFKRNAHKVPLESIKKMFDRWESTESIKEKINGYLV